MEKFFVFNISFVFLKWGTFSNQMVIFTRCNPAAISSQSDYIVEDGNLNQ